MWGHSEKVAICKSGRELSPETAFDGTLNVDFQPLELWEDKSLLFKPHNLWYFVLVAKAD